MNNSERENGSAVNGSAGERNGSAGNDGKRGKACEIRGAPVGGLRVGLGERHLGMSRLSSRLTCKILNMVSWPWEHCIAMLGPYAGIPAKRVERKWFIL